MNWNENVQSYKDGKETEHHDEQHSTNQELSDAMESAETSFPRKHTVNLILSDQERSNKARYIDSNCELRSIKTDVNPGIGLKMTSQRSQITKPSTCMTPCPQTYDISYKLSEQEKRQNKLLSDRYH